MISAIDYLDIDVSDHLNKFIEAKKNSNKMIKDLEDNILLSIHMNYSNIFKSYNKFHQHTLNNKKELLNHIRKISNTEGWIQDCLKFRWKVIPKSKSLEYGICPNKSSDPNEFTDQVRYGNPLRKIYLVQRQGYGGYVQNNVDGHLRVRDSKGYPTEIWKHYYSYPPTEYHYNTNDLIKHIKIK